MLEKIEGENETLWQSLRTWEKEEQRLARSRNGKPKPAVKKQKEEEESPTEVWANVRVTRDFCMAKINPYPAWPAKRCEPKDKELAASLKAVGRVLVSLIGEDGGLRVVKLEDIRPFDGKVDNEDLSDQPKAIRSQLDEVRITSDSLCCFYDYSGSNSLDVVSCSAWSWLDESFEGVSMARWGKRRPTWKRRNRQCSARSCVELNPTGVVS